MRPGGPHAHVGQPTYTPHHSQDAVACRKRLKKARRYTSMAEREGFEPPDRRRSTVFKTAAFDHSATSPALISKGFFNTS
jgi:hypothetical protein